MPFKPATPDLVCRAVALAALDCAVPQAAAEGACYSDMQQTGMPSNFNDLRLNAGHAAGAASADAEGETANFAVENVVAPRRVYDDKKTRVLVTVAGFATKKSTHNVSLMLNGRDGGEQGGRSAGKRARHRGVSVAGRAVRAQQRRSEDRLRRYAAGGRHVLFLGGTRRPASRAVRARGGESRGLLYFKAALEASGQSAFEIDAGQRGADRRNQPVEVRLRGAVGRRRAAGRLRKRAARHTCAAAAAC